MDHKKELGNNHEYPVDFRIERAEAWEKSSENVGYEKEKTRVPPKVSALHIISTLVYRAEKEESAKLDQSDRENLSEEQISFYLHRLMALAEDYILLPKSEKTRQMHKRRIKYNSLADLSGDDLIDSFQEIEMAGFEEKAEEQQETNANRSIIEDVATDILTHRQVRERFRSIYSQERKEYHQARDKIDQIVRYEALLKIAQFRIREIQGEPYFQKSDSAPSPLSITEAVRQGRVK